jgi:hypothetical protein
LETSKSAWPHWQRKKKSKQRKETSSLAARPSHTHKCSGTHPPGTVAAHHRGRAAASSPLSSPTASINSHLQLSLHLKPPSSTTDLHSTNQNVHLSQINTLLHTASLFVYASPLTLPFHLLLSPTLQIQLNHPSSQEDISSLHNSRTLRSSVSIISHQVTHLS